MKITIFSTAPYLRGIGHHILMKKIIDESIAESEDSSSSSDDHAESSSNGDSDSDSSESAAHPSSRIGQSGEEQDRASDHGTCAEDCKEQV